VKRQPLDVCVCGDYRRDHENGTGPCTFGLDLSHGFTDCAEFRLSSNARPRSRLRFPLCGEKGVDASEGCRQFAINRLIERRIS